MKSHYVLLLLIITLAFSCKDPELVGIDTLQDSEGYVGTVVDTFSISGAYFLDNDSIRTSNLNTAYVLGGFNDPVFGKVSSTMYTQFHLASDNVVFEDDAEIDSVVVFLKYLGSYGSTDRFKGYQTLNVYKLEDNIYDDSTYFSFDSTHVKGDLLASHYFRPDLYNNYALNDTLSIDPTLRIPLDSQYGSDIINSNGLTFNVDFLKLFKGLVFEPQTDALPVNHGAVLYLSMYSSQTFMRLYYHSASLNTEIGHDTTLTYDLFVGTDAATHTSFHHSYPLNLLQDTANNTAGEQQLLVQALGGIRSKIEFPTLRGLKTDEAGNSRAISINKAELIIPIEAGNFADYPPPLNLTLAALDSNGNDVFLLDNLEGVEYFGGQYDATNLEYRFNVARHIHRILDNEGVEPSITILNSGNSVNGYRGILNGTNHPLRPIKLRVTFTELD